MNHKKEKIYRGGEDLERLFLHDQVIETDNSIIEVKKSIFPAVKDMADVIMRHVGRYGLALPYIRPGFKILDFPCGSGLALEVFKELGKFGTIVYEGWDLDAPTIAYAREIYGKNFTWTKFETQSLTNFHLPPASYDTICCIEGIEHIDSDSQKKAVSEFYNGLKDNGILIVSSPTPESGHSGINPKNPYHLWELSKDDFRDLLAQKFGQNNVELISQKNLLTTGQLINTVYAVCHKK